MLAKARSRAESDAYRIYIGETLYFMANGKAPSMRVQEFVHPKPEEPERDADEIISTMKNKLEGLVNK